MMAFSFRFPIVFLMLTMLPTCANVSASRGSAQEFPTTEPGARPTAGVTPVVSSDSRELWCNDQPVPRAADIPQLEGVEYSLIQARVPEVDGYSWLHGVALAWHRGQLYASFGRNRGEENTATEEAQLRISQDGGRSWGPVATIDVGPGENEAISHGVFLEHEMQLWCFTAVLTGICSMCVPRPIDGMTATAPGLLREWSLEMDSGPWKHRKSCRTATGSWEV